MAELADAQDLKSCGPNGPYGFDPRSGYFSFCFTSLRVSVSRAQAKADIQRGMP